MRSERELEGVPTPLRRLIAAAEHRLLMLDYDGTLAPFVVDRDEARPLPGSIAVLRRIASSRHTRVAIVSGRPVREVERLTGPLPVTFVGEHGWERREPDGSLVQLPMDPKVEAAISEGERIARAAGWGEFVERKRTAVVLHTRGLTEAEAKSVQDRCAEAWSPLAIAGQVNVDRIDGGMEVRARASNKGTVVRSLLAQAPPGTLGVFIGDDVTDEDAFEAVRDRGFGVRVGGQDRASFALGRLPTCEAVTRFLEEWLALVEDTHAGAS